MFMLKAREGLPTHDGQKEVPSNDQHGASFPFACLGTHSFQAGLLNVLSWALVSARQRSALLWPLMWRPCVAAPLVMHEFPQKDF